MLYKILFFGLILIGFSFDNQQNIELEDIQFIRIIDYWNYNYDYSIIREYDIKIHNKKAILYNTKRLSRYEYLEKYHRKDLDKFEKKIEVYEDLVYGKRDEKSADKYFQYLDSINLVMNKWHDDYLDNVESKFIKVIGNKLLDELIQLINEKPVDEYTFLKLHNRSLPDTLSLIDTLTLQNCIDYCNVYLSSYPLIAMEVITKTDTIKFYSKSQNNPPMPWVIEKDGIKIKTYNNEFNQLLSKILPKYHDINRKRLKSNIQLLVEKCCKLD